ncbi:hypothetical protein AVEN_234413-1 [Araneus ventricosus]|uniref:Uncharacterized protein n=1 Tax=Araneus ventricosus TaxID=182803 RepID=A0A4Y2A9T2_ARAVE|nr:hypothetical protein AVEN_234413-1 [Araneus ventricosus]
MFANFPDNKFSSVAPGFGFSSARTPSYPVFDRTNMKITTASIGLKSKNKSVLFASPELSINKEEKPCQKPFSHNSLFAQLSASPRFNKSIAVKPFMSSFSFGNISEKANVKQSSSFDSSYEKSHVKSSLSFGSNSMEPPVKPSLSFDSNSKIPSVMLFGSNSKQAPVKPSSPFGSCYAKTPSPSSGFNDSIGQTLYAFPGLDSSSEMTPCASTGSSSTEKHYTFHGSNEKPHCAPPASDRSSVEVPASVGFNYASPKTLSDFNGFQICNGGKSSASTGYDSCPDKPSFPGFDSAGTKTPFASFGLDNLSAKIPSVSPVLDISSAKTPSVSPGLNSGNRRLYSAIPGFDSSSAETPASPAINSACAKTPSASSEFDCSNEETDSASYAFDNNSTEETACSYFDSANTETESPSFGLSNNEGSSAFPNYASS